MKPKITNITGLKPYSVLLLYPDYMSDNYGQETYFCHVRALNPDEAIENAQAEAVQANTPDGEEPDLSETEDFAPLLVLDGHHTQPAWG
jgi:hypothetical protein